MRRWRLGAWRVQQPQRSAMRRRELTRPPQGRRVGVAEVDQDQDRLQLHDSRGRDA